MERRADGKAMRIMFVADSLKFGGAERHLVTVATGFSGRGNEVVVTYLKPYDELAGELLEGGVSSVVCCNSRGGFDLAAIRRLAFLIRDFAPNILVVSAQYSLMFTVLARLWLRNYIPLLFVCHSMEHVRRSRRERLRFSVYRHFYRIADHVVFVSDLQRIFFLGLGVRPNSNEVIHNGIDLDRFSACSVESESRQIRHGLGFDDQDFVIGMCAVFRDEKRQVDLIEALRRLRDKGFKAKVLLVGDGNMRSQIEARCDSLNLQEHVVLCGFQQDVRPYVAACDVMALTSHAETFPIATLEYMALGKALVASDVGGVCEQVADGVNGYLYPAGDIPALTNCLEKLSDINARELMGTRSRREVEARFSITVMIERFHRACSVLARI